MKERAGTTLMELIVSSALMLVLMGSLVAIFSSASRYYLSMTNASDVQRACLLAANRVAGEMAEGNLQAVLDDPNDLGVVFASPRSRDLQVHFDPNTKELQWQQFICFFVERQGVTGRLRRQHEFFAPVTQAPLPTQGIAHFQSLSAGPNSGLAGIIAENIYFLQVDRGQDIRITIGAKDERGEYRVSVKTSVHARN